MFDAGATQAVVKMLHAPDKQRMINVAPQSLASKRVVVALRWMLHFPNGNISCDTT